MVELLHLFAENGLADSHWGAQGRTRPRGGKQQQQHYDQKEKDQHGIGICHGVFR